MNLPRKLLLAIGIWAVTPSLATLGHAELLPDRAGTYKEVIGPRFSAPARTQYEFDPPNGIGQRHITEVGPIMGFGTPEERVWYGQGPRHGSKRPALVLLHGSGRDGRAMLAMWKDFAKRQRLILVAPDARTSRDWWMVTDGPGFLMAVLKDAAQTYPIDPDQIYLVGHSAGAGFAMKLANLGVGPWRAVATHAGYPAFHRILPSVAPVPVHAFAGDADRVYAIDGHRRALQTLARAGHDTSLTVLPAHTHWYYDIGTRLAPLMWQALRRSG